MMKKLLSLFLAVAMLCSLFIPVSAAGAIDNLSGFADVINVTPVQVKGDIEVKTTGAYAESVVATQGANISTKATIDMTNVIKAFARAERELTTAAYDEFKAKAVSGSFIIAVTWSNGVYILPENLETGNLAGFTFVPQDGRSADDAKALFKEAVSRVKADKTLTITIEVNDGVTVSDLVDLPKEISLEYSGFGISADSTISGSIEASTTVADITTTQGEPIDIAYDFCDADDTSKEIQTAVMKIYVGGGGGSSTSSSGTSKPGDKVKPEVELKNENTSAKIEATVKDNDVTISKIDDKELDSIIGKNVDSGMITLDVAATVKDAEKISIPAKALVAISKAVNDEDNAADGFEITFGAGKFDIDTKALSTLASAAGSKNVEFIFRATDNSDITAAQNVSVGKLADRVATYETIILSNGVKVSDFKGGNVTLVVKFPINADEDVKSIKSWYISDSGKTEELETSYDGTSVSFTTPHFSDFAIGVNKLPFDAWEEVFDDVNQGDWFYDIVKEAHAAGLMNGVSKTSFDPNAPITRAMFITVLHRMEGEPVSDYEVTFEDLGEDMYYEKAVAWGAENVIIKGYSDTEFAPDQIISREQMAAIVHRYAGYKDLDQATEAELTYSDANSISEYAREAVQWNTEKGILKGNADGTFKPQNYATRAEAAAVFTRVANIIK